jgi:hypothetical protein
VPCSGQRPTAFVLWRLRFRVYPARREARLDHFDVAVAVMARRTCVYLTPGIRRRARSAVVVIRAYQPGSSHVGAPTGRRCSTAIVCGSVYLRIPCSPCGARGRMLSCHPLVHRALHGHHRLTARLQQLHADPLGTPTRVLAPHLHHHDLDITAAPMRAAVRAPGPINQTGHTLGQIPAQQQ